MDTSSRWLACRISEPGCPLGYQGIVIIISGKFIVMKTSTSVFLVAALTLIGLKGAGQTSIQISGTRFAYPLIERWIAEYNKTGANTSFQLSGKTTAGEVPDIRIVGRVLDKSEVKATEEVITVSKYALLVVGNGKNKGLEKFSRKGIKPEEARKLFFEDPDDDFETEKGAARYRVYTNNSRVCSSVTFARFFKEEPENIFGKYVTGGDNHLLEAVKRDSLGVTYTNPGYLYDLSSRAPREGLIVLPIDFNKNGKLEKEEKIYENLDDLIGFLELNAKKQYLPTEEISFIIDKNQSGNGIRDFIKWIQGEGQSFSHEYGFLTLGSPEGHKSAYNIKPTR